MYMYDHDDSLVTFETYVLKQQEGQYHLRYVNNGRENFQYVNVIHIRI